MLNNISDDADDAGMVDDVSATNNNGAAAATIAVTAAGIITPIDGGHVVPVTTVTPEIKFQVDLVTVDPASGTPVGSSFRSESPSNVTPTVDPAPFTPIGDAHCRSCTLCSYWRRP